MALSSNLRGALFMVVSMAGFTLSDGVSKYVSVVLTGGEIMAVRGLFATALIGALAWRQGALRNPRRVLHPTVIVRALSEGAATVAFLYALAHLPIAVVSAVLQALPLGVTMGAALFFAEPVGWRRWSAIAAGFAGVLVVVRPGAGGLSLFALYALASVGFCVVRDLATRRVPPDVPSLMVSSMTSVTVTVLGFLVTVPTGEWVTPPLWSVGMLMVSGVLVVIGYQFIIMAVRSGDVSFIAPFRYTSLLWSIMLGFAVFGDVPDAGMIVGSVIIVGSGLYTLYREQAAGKRRIAAESTTPSLAPEGL